MTTCERGLDVLLLDEPTPRKHGVAEPAFRAFAMLATFLMVTLAIAYVAQIGSDTGAGLVPGLAHQLKMVWPQKWSFFTGMESSYMVVAYHLDDTGRLTTPIDERLTWRAAAGGFDRSMGTSTSVMTLVAKDVPQRYWQGCTSAALTGCAIQIGAAHEYSAADTWSAPGLCGPVALVVEHAAPSGPHTVPQPARVVYRVAAVDLECAG